MKGKAMAWLFALVMLAFCLFLCAWIPVRAQLDFQLADTALSLETSRGRERKQQAEYDQVQRELPQIRAELEETLPMAEEAARRVASLKTERKALRAEKKEIEETLAGNGESAGISNGGPSGEEGEP